MSKMFTGAARMLEREIHESPKHEKWDTYAWPHRKKPKSAAKTGGRKKIKKTSGGGAN